MVSLEKLETRESFHMLWDLTLPNRIRRPWIWHRSFRLTGAFLFSFVITIFIPDKHLCIRRLALGFVEDLEHEYGFRCSRTPNVTGSSI